MQLKWRRGTTQKFLQETEDLVTFTEEIHNGKLHFFCSGVGNSLAWRLENAHIKLNLLQKRCPFFYNSSAFLLSFLYIVWISFCPGSSTLEPFSLFYYLIASYYTKGKWQWRQGYLFCFESYHFDQKIFLYLFFSFWYEELT